MATSDSISVERVIDAPRRAFSTCSYGGTRVRESFDWSNGRGTWFLRLTGRPETNRRNIEQTLERLAKICGGQPSAPPA